MTKAICLGVAALILLCLVVVGIVHYQRSTEERRLYAGFSDLLKPEADARYNALSLGARLATARRAKPVADALRRTGWTTFATDLQPAGTDEDAYDFVYQLQVGDSELTGCVVGDPLGDPAGSCHSFSHTLPAELRDPAGDGPPRQTQDVPLELHFGSPAYASSPGKVRLALGTTNGFQAEGQVSVNDQDVRVTQAALLVPDPLHPETEVTPVDIPDFSPRTVLQIQSIQSSYPFPVVYDMPAVLAPFFEENQGKLALIDGQVAVRIDLLHPGYHLEGELTVLNHYLGRGIVEFYPGDHASLYLENLSIPAALPAVCFNIKSALVELDFKEERLRLLGTSELDTVDGFLCEEGGVAQDMGIMTRLALEMSLSTARAALGLPEAVSVHGDLVVDVDDSIVCADLAADGHSLLHAAYLGNAKAFQMWAPKSFVTADVSGDRFVGSAWDILTDSWSADWAFPDSNPLRCWDGDSGPRTDMRFSLLEPAPPPITPVL